MQSFNFKLNVFTKTLLTCFYTTSYPLARNGGNSSSATTITQAQGPGGKTINSALRKISIIVAKAYPVATTTGWKFCAIYIRNLGAESPVPVWSTLLLIGLIPYSMEELVTMTHHVGTIGISGFNGGLISNGCKQKQSGSTFSKQDTQISKA